MVEGIDAGSIPHLHTPDYIKDHDLRTKEAAGAAASNNAIRRAQEYSERLDQAEEAELKKIGEKLNEKAIGEYAVSPLVTEISKQVGAGHIPPAAKTTWREISRPSMGERLLKGINGLVKKLR